MKKRIASIVLAIAIVCTMSVIAFAKVPTTNPNLYAASTNPNGITTITWNAFFANVTTARSYITANENDEVYVDSTLTGVQSVMTTLDNLSTSAWGTMTETELAGYNDQLSAALAEVKKVTDFSNLTAQLKIVQNAAGLSVETNPDGSVKRDNNGELIITGVSTSTVQGKELVKAYREAYEIWLTRKTATPASQKEINKATKALKAAAEDCPAYYGFINDSLDAVPGWKAAVETAKQRAAQKAGTTYTTDMAAEEFLYNEALMLIYTEESVDALYDAIDAVEWNLSILDQDKVDAYEKAIVAATGALEIRDHDSDKVAAGLAEAGALNANVAVSVAGDTIDEVFTQLQADKDAKGDEAVKGDGGEAGSDGESVYDDNGIIPDTGDAVLGVVGALMLAAGAAFVLKKKVA